MDPKSAHKSYHAGHKNFIPEDKILKYGFLFVIPGLLLLSVLYLVFFQTQLLYHPNSTNSSAYLSPTPYPTTVSELIASPDTSTWKTYKISTVNMEFKLPPEIYSKGNLQELIHDNPAATFCFRFSPISASFKSQYSLTGFCYGDKQDRFRLGASAYAYSSEVVGGITVSELQGFTMKDGKYYSKFSDRLIESPLEIKNHSLTRKLINPNKVEILRIKGDPNETREPNSTWITIGKGWVGAIINTNDVKYPGFSVQVQLINGVDENTFDEILSTFRFTN